MILQNIAAALLYACGLALICAIAGAAWLTAKQGGNVGTFFSSLTNINCPEYPPTNIGNVFFFLLYATLGAMIYLGRLATNPGNSTLMLGFSYINIFSLIAFIQAGAMFVWPRISYTAANTPNQVRINFFDIAANMDLVKTLFSKISIVFNPSNWNLTYAPFLIPFVAIPLAMLIAAWTLYCAVANGDFFAAPCYIVLQGVFIQFMLNILADQNLSSPS